MFVPIVNTKDEERHLIGNVYSTKVGKESLGSVAHEEKTKMGGGKRKELPQDTRKGGHLKVKLFRFQSLTNEGGPSAPRGKE